MRINPNKICNSKLFRKARKAAKIVLLKIAIFKIVKDI